MTRITTPLLFERTINGIADTQAKLAKLNQQITSTKKASTFKELDSDITRTIDLESSIADTDRYIRSNKFVVNRLTSIDSAISAMQNVALSFKQVLSRENSSSGSVQDLSELARTALDNISDQLNKQNNGRYLFAGSKTDSPAVGDLKAETSIVSGIATTNYYLGDDVTFAVKSSDSLEVNYGIKANEDAFRNLIGSIHMAIDAETSGSNEDLVTAGSMLDQAMEELVTLRSKVGTDIQSLEEANNQHQLTKSQLNEFLSNIVDTDIVAASIEVSQNQAILTAAMQSFVRISNLSLTDFL